MKFFLFFVVLVGTFVLLNPDEDDFKAFVQERTEDVVSEHARTAAGDLFGSVAGVIGGRVVAAVASGAVVRKNYVLFSLHTLDLDGAREEGEEWKFLGIGGQFFELRRPEMLEEG